MPFPRVVAVLLLCLLLLPVAAPAKATLRVPYTGAAVLGFNGVADACGAMLPLGTVCVDVPRGASSLVVGAVDQLGARVGGSWYAADAAGQLVGAGVHCGPTDVALPRGTAQLVVRVEAINGPIWCLEDGLAAPPLRGWVSLRFA